MGCAWPGRAPRGPSKLTEELAARIRLSRGQGRSLRAVATEVGVSTDTVRRALADGLTAPGQPGGGDGGGDGENGGDKELEVLARPEPRGAERALAHAGVLFGATPVICQGGVVEFRGGAVDPVGVTSSLRSWSAMARAVTAASAIDLAHRDGQSTSA